MPTVLITGANRGLGLEFAKQYAANEYAVIALCRHPEKADELKKLMDRYNRVRIEGVDVGDQASVRVLTEKLGETEIDLLINNAGIYSGGDKPTNAVSGDDGQTFGSIDAKAWDQVLRINTIAPIMMIEALMPHLQRSACAKVVNITSKMGSISEMGSGAIAYRSSKAALNAAMRVIAHDLQKHNITIVNLHPGWVQTDMGGASATLDTKTSVNGMRKVIDGIDSKHSGQFIGYDGKIIPW